MKGIRRKSGRLQQELQRKFSTGDEKMIQEKLQDKFRELTSAEYEMRDNKNVKLFTSVYHTKTVSFILTMVCDNLVTDKKINVDLKAMPTLQTERILILQVFSNLIGNAVKYTQKWDVWLKYIISNSHTYMNFLLKTMTYINMPEMDGLELPQLIRNQPEWISLNVLSVRHPVNGPTGKEPKNWGSPALLYNR